MSTGYNPREIESKWQAHWEAHKTFRTPNPGEPGFDPARPKFYCLDMFPYPSGAGLHVGHPEGYTATDIVARFKRMKGYNVLHPMGWDAFGLPAEQHAMDTGQHPAVTTKKNIDNFRRQLKMLGFGYDWDRELSTTDPDYYRWTQWIFLQLFNSWYDPDCRWTDADGREVTGRARPIEKMPIPAEIKARGGRAVREYVDGHRMAYLAEVPVNWCPALGTVLANEEVTNEGRSERGNHPVYRRPLKQWMLRITKYADRLERDLEELAWPESVKIMQRNWIGRSEGARVRFQIAPQQSGNPGAPGRATGEARRVGTAHHEREEISPAKGGQCPSYDSPTSGGQCPPYVDIFTTRPDTLFGATYLVLAPEHPLVKSITVDGQREKVEAYCAKAAQRSDLDRTTESKKKTGVFTGGYAINPGNQEWIPVWVADYVLMGYGTGAIMAVPAHDERDFEFAKQFNLGIRAVVRPPASWIQEQVVANRIDTKFARQRGMENVAELLVRSASTTANALNVTGLDIRAVLDGDAGWIEQVALPAYLEDPGLFMEAYTADGVAVHSGGFDGLSTPMFKKKITAWLDEMGLGAAKVNYKLRDWLFSRQRYWGEPFPILHGPDGELIALDESELPLTLPEIQDFRPTVEKAEQLPAPDAKGPLSHGCGSDVPQPPLGRAKEWASVTRDGKTCQRELNTMPQWAGSCWYYLRFIDPKNTARFCGTDAERYWMVSRRKDGRPHFGGIDLYLGGAEHAVLHLLYARFWHKVLYDLGHVSTPEPFGKLFNQGMIRAFAYTDARGTYIGYEDIEFRDEAAIHKQTGETLHGAVEKMSKSLKNVINPEEVVGEYGADSLRLYEMFMGPLDASKPWNPRDVPGVFRFLQRTWRLIAGEDETRPLSAMILADDDPGRDPGGEVREGLLQLEKSLHRTIRKVTEDIERLAFNTAISSMMEFVNEALKAGTIARSQAETLTLLLSPFAPHLAEELWQRLRGYRWKGSLAHETWPKFNERLLEEATVEIPVQINGKLAGRVAVPKEADEASVAAAAAADARVAQRIAGGKVVKSIYIPGRMLNLIVR